MNLMNNETRIVCPLDTSLEYCPQNHINSNNCFKFKQGDIQPNFIALSESGPVCTYTNDGGDTNTYPITSSCLSQAIINENI